MDYYSNLKGVRLLDKAGTHFGDIDDLAIELSNGEILYIVVHSNNDENRAILLGAFVKGQEADCWSIDLEAEQILKFKPFDLKVPPMRVDRGWEEYASTKYGRGGLQPHKKVD